MTKHILASVLLALSAATLWASSRMTWYYVEAFDDKSGAKTQEITGAAWASEIVALALVLTAAAVAGLTLRRTPRRIVGIIAAIIGAAAGWSAMTALLTEVPDYGRALGILSSQVATSRSSEGALLSSWAEITAMTTNTFAVVIALVGAALAVFAGGLLAIAPGKNKEASSAYARKQQRAQRIQSELEAEPDSGRVLWDAIDADIDPTDDQR